MIQKKTVRDIKKSVWPYIVMPFHPAAKNALNVDIAGLSIYNN
jgi:hypothetical protein